MASSNERHFRKLCIALSVLFVAYAAVTTLTDTPAVPADLRLRSIALTEHSNLSSPVEGEDDGGGGQGSTNSASVSTGAAGGVGVVGSDSNSSNSSGMVNLDQPAASAIEWHWKTMFQTRPGFDWRPPFTMESGVETLKLLRTQATDTGGFTDVVRPSSATAAAFLPEPYKPLPSTRKRPGAVLGKAAMCPYGLLRHRSTIASVFKRTVEFTSQFDKDLFVSTWDFEQTGSSVKKVARKEKKSWFNNGKVQPNMLEILKEVFVGVPFVGYFIANHLHATKCSSAACLVAMVRGNCLQAIVAREAKINAVYPVLMLHRMDRGIVLPVFFTAQCFAGATEKAGGEKNEQTAVSRLDPVPVRVDSSGMLLPSPNITGEGCTFQAGYCTSFFRRRMWMNTAALLEGHFATHLFLCRTKLKDPWGRMGMVSDYAAIGLRNSVASFIVSAASRMSQNMTQWYSSEVFLAETAMDSNMWAKCVNLGYERALAMGTGAAAVGKEDPTGFGADVPSATTNPPEEAAKLSNSSAATQDSPGRSSAEQDLFRIRTSNEVSEVATNPNVTCGTLAPKYLTDMCSYDSNVMVPMAGHSYERWKTAARSCCSSKSECNQKNRKRKK